LAGIQEAIGEILKPLMVRRWTPVVVFIPLALFVRHRRCVFFAHWR